MQRLTPHLQRQARQQHATTSPTTDENIHHAENARDVDPSSRQVLQLQGIIGNQAVQRLMVQQTTNTASADIQRVTEGEDYIHSAHSQERMQERNISQTQLERTLDNPDIVNDLGGGRREYLNPLPSGLIMCVIVTDDHPMTIITMMKVRKHKSYR